MSDKSSCITAKRSERNPAVLILTLNQPQQRNAMSADLVAALLSALEAAASDGETQTILLRGAGKGFCSGSDLAGLASMSAEGRQRFEADSGRLARAICDHPLPIVAAVTGFAIGGGLTLAAACDFVVSEADAKWSLPEVPIGLFPAWGLEQVVDRIGRSAARRLAFGADMLDGRRAAEIGLVDMLADDVIEVAHQQSTKLAALPMQQSAAVKSYFATAPRTATADARANELFIAACGSSAAASLFAKYR